MPQSPTVLVLPQTGGRVICVAYQGAVRADDLENNLNRPLDRLIETYGTYRLLVHYTTRFAGWTPEAATVNFRHIGKVGPLAERLAFVNPPRRKILQLKFQQFIWKAQMRIFDESALNEALEWITGP